MNDVGCDWSLEGCDLRACVEGYLAEKDRCADSEVMRQICEARVILNGRISLDEYRAMKERMRAGKATGVDGIPFECFRGLRDDNGILVSVLDDVMVDLFNTILLSGKYPEAWRLAILVPLLKGTNVDASLPTNYRGITLLSTMSKMFSNILERRLTEFQWATGRISDFQFGFTRDRRTLDPVFILNTMIEKAKADGTKLYVAFIDFRKACDFVLHHGLFF